MQHPFTAALLVVDDEEQVRLILRRQLERLGYQVTLVTDGPEALNELTTSPTSYAAVIIDLTLPEMDGITLARTIADRRHHPALLLMSGFHATELKEQIETLPIAGFLQKPFTLADLRSMLEQVLTGSNE